MNKLLKALSIAKILFAQEGYHTTYLEEIETIMRRCSMSVNKVVLVGNLGQDPELRWTLSGKPVCRFSVATSNTWTAQDGEKQQKTEWHNVVVWGNRAEACHHYLQKGRQVYVEGALQTRTYDDEIGTGKKKLTIQRKITEIVARRVQFLGTGQKDVAPTEDGTPSCKEA